MSCTGGISVESSPFIQWPSPKWGIVTCFWIYLVLLKMNHSAIASESQPKIGSSSLILYLIYLIALEWNVFIMQKVEYVTKSHWEKTLNLWDSCERGFQSLPYLLHWPHLRNVRQIQTISVLDFFRYLILWLRAFDEMHLPAWSLKPFETPVHINEQFT